MTHRSFTCTLVLSVFAVSGCNHEKKELEHPVYLATRPARQDTALTQRFVSQIRSIQHIELRAMERGYLERVFVDEGQPVKRGQRLFQILPTMYQAELQKAQAEAEFARLEFENTRLLADRKVVSANELALGQARLDKANAELSLARVHRDFTEIRAPFDGIMGRLSVRLGSLVSEGDLLSTLSDNGTMWVYFNVAEADYLDYRAHFVPGAPLQGVKLELANGSLFSHDGKVETIEADFNNETGTIAFRATFPNPEGLLRHGETGTVLLSKPLPHALLIPQKSTFEVLDKRYVYVLDVNQVARARQVTVAAELPHVFVVAAGLDETDTLLLEGIARVRDGDVVESRFVASTEVFAHLAVPAQ
jgi:membrane fusion protein, multidrug efflux system